MQIILNEIDDKIIPNLENFTYNESTFLIDILKAVRLARELRDNEAMVFAECNPALCEILNGAEFITIDEDDIEFVWFLTKIDGHKPSDNSNTPSGSTNKQQAYATR